MSRWEAVYLAAERIAWDDPDPRRRAKARALVERMRLGSGSMAAISVGSGFVAYPVTKPDGAGWAEHQAIEDGDG